ncbi:hypothetical protein FACS189418_9390 [Clostridia bacterium]|nr:hypothetical protein FACS189418_9390 [Clostridia bacterium]
MYVVKRGLSAMLTIFGSFAVFIGFYAVYMFWLKDSMSLLMFLWLCAAVCFLVSVLNYLWLMKYGVKRFIRLSE